MGPAATADFFAKLVRATPAAEDQAHLRVVIWSDPTVPDRTAALLGQGPDPSAAMSAGADVLAAAGCTLIAIPCNTAHAFLPCLRARHELPVVNIVEETVLCATRLSGAAGAVGVLATTGAVVAGLYGRELARHGIEAIHPGQDDQAVLMDAIAAVKASGPSEQARRQVRRIAARLVRDGAEAIILGCSELPLLVDVRTVDVPTLDSTQCLAEAVVARAWHRSPGDARGVGLLP